MQNSTAIILLAAGGSSRLGEPKQLLDFDGEPLIHRVARQLIALDVGPVGVVVGCRRAQVIAAIADLSAAVIENDDWPKGIGTSIVAGIRRAKADPSVGAAMIVLCDQPAIDATHLRSLIDRSTSGVTIVATHYAGTLGVPAVFKRAAFDRLLELPPESGAKVLFNDPTLKVESVPCDAARIDLDTPDDVARWRR